MIPVSAVLASPGAEPVLVSVSRSLPPHADHAGQPPLPARYYARSSAWGVRQVLPPAVLLAACIAALGYAGTAWKIAAAVMVAFAGYRLTFVVHDCSHRTLFAGRRTNDVVGWLAAALLLISFPAYRRLHWQHHRHYGRADDPQGHDYVGLRPGHDRVLWHLCKPLVLANLLEKAGAFFAVHHAGLTATERANAEVGSRREAISGLACIAAVQCAVAWVATGGLSFPAGYVLYLAPLVTIGLFLSRVRSYLEHGALEAAEANRPVARTHPSGPLERRLLSGLYFNFHNEHHRWPQVPSRHLPTVHREVTADALRPSELSPTYVASLMVLVRTSLRRDAK